MKIRILIVAVFSIFSIFQLIAQDKCLYFDGIDNHVLTPSSALNDIGSGDFTFMAWIKGSAEDQNQHPRIFSNRASTSQGTMFFLHDAFGGSQHKLLTVQLNNTNYLIVGDDGDINVLDDTFHHVAISRIGVNLSFYIDGDFIGSRSVPFGATTASSTPLYIGQDVNITNDSFKGVIARLSIWNRGLTADEISNTYCEDFNGGEPNLVAYWRLNEGEGQTVMDLAADEISFLGLDESEEIEDPNWGDNCIIEACTDDCIPSYELYENYTINNGETLELNGEIYSLPGNYIQELSTSSGCDSIININLSVRYDILHFDLESCLSNTLGEGDVYSEFVPAYPESPACSDVNSTFVFRKNNMVNKHSCTPGYDGNVAMCISSLNACSYDGDSEKALKFEVDFDVQDQSSLVLNTFSFYHRAPDNYDWIDGPSGLNNPPTLFGFRILSNDVELYRVEDIPTASEWELYVFEFEDEISLSQTKLLSFELLPYCLAGTGSNVSAWDIDEIHLDATCTPDPVNRPIGGSILESADGMAVENIEVNLVSATESLTTFPDEYGKYAFDGDVDNQYKISASKFDENMMGVNTIDLIMLQRHILELEEIENCRSLVAGDVNFDQKLSVTDLVNLRKLILGIKSFDQGAGWKFVFDYVADGNPWTLSEDKTIMPGIDPSMDNDMMTVKIGDIDNSYFESLIENINSTRTSNVIELNIETSQSADGNQEVSFYASEDGYYSGLQLNFIGNKFSNIIGQKLQINDDNYHVGQNTLKLVWSQAIPVFLKKDEALFSMVTSSEVILNDEGMENAIFLGSTLDKYGITLKEITTEEHDFDFSIYPNPTASDFRIGLSTSKSEVDFRIDIYNATGALINTKKVVNYESELSYVNFEQGLYFVKVSNGVSSYVKKLIVNN